MSIKVAPLEKCTILTPLQKLPKNVEYLGKLFEGFEKLPKVKLIAQSGHTNCDRRCCCCSSFAFSFARIGQKKINSFPGWKNVARASC